MSKLIVAARAIARGGECLRLLFKAGLSVDDLEAANDDVRFRLRLATFWLRRGIPVELKETESQQAARVIMGNNFLGLPEVAQYFGDLSEAQTADLAEVPFSEDILRACSKTHMLEADIGLSILDVRQKARKLFYSSQDWFKSEGFAQETDKPRWRLIRKTLVDNSTIKTWSEQQELIPQTDEVPSARQVVYMAILHFLSTGERLFEEFYVRTSSVALSGYRVCVGKFEGNRGLYHDGLYIYYYNGLCRARSCGVSSSRLLGSPAPCH